MAFAVGPSSPASSAFFCWSDTPIPTGAPMNVISESESNTAAARPRLHLPASLRTATAPLAPASQGAPLDTVTHAIEAVLQARQVCRARPQLLAELDRALPHLANVRRALLNVGATGSPNTTPSPYPKTA